MSRKSTPKPKLNSASPLATLEQKLYLTLYKLSKLQCSRPFLYPVDTNLYKDYLTTIEHPMDLNTIITKLKKSQYQIIGEIHDDLMLICKNCYNYNKDKINFQNIEKVLGRFIKSMELAWVGLKKELKESGIQEDTKLLEGKQMEDKILQLEEKIKLSIIKKVERLSNDSVLENSTILAASELSINKKKQRRVLEKHSVSSEKIQLKNEQVMEGKQPEIQHKNQLQRGQLKQKSEGANENVAEKPQSPRNQPLHKNIENYQSGSQVKPQVEENIEKEVYSKDGEKEDDKDEEECTVSIAKPIRLQIENYPKQQEHQQEPFKFLKPLIEIQIDKQHEPQILEIEDKPSQNQNTAEIQINRKQVESQLNNTVKRKLRKYQKLIQNYLLWIMDNIINAKINVVCTQHNPQIPPDGESQNQESLKLCIQCSQMQKEQKLNKELRSLSSFKYLSGYLSAELANLKKGDVNLKKLLKLLEEFNLWLRLLAAPYMSWRIKDNYIEIQKCILICLEKIIQYKKLGPEFTKILQQPKEENRKILNQKNGRRITRSRGNINKTRLESERQNRDKYSIFNLINQKQIQKLNLNQEKLKNHQQFFNLLENDQVHCNFKIIILRDFKNTHQFKILDKREFLDRKKRLKKKKKQLLAEEVELDESKVEQEYTPDVQQVKEVQQIFKKPKLNQIQRQAEELRQNRRKIRFQLKNDEEFLYQYSLRSNVLVIGKYKERLQLDWDEKWKSIFGEVPNRLIFDDEQTKVGDFQQQGRVEFCI